MYVLKLTPEEYSLVIQCMAFDVTYATETGVNVVVLGEDGFVYEAMLTGGEAFLESTAEMIGGTLKRA